MNLRKFLGLLVILTFVAVPFVRAHEMTYQGIVLEVDAAKAEAVRVHVKTIDAKTKKEENVWFTLGKSTKVKRGDRSLTVAAAKIVKDERIVVIVDHDDSDKVEVKEVRLAAQTR